MIYTNPYINDLIAGFYSYDPLSFMRIASQAEFIEIAKFGALAGFLMLIIDALILNLLVYRRFFVPKSMSGDIVRAVLKAPILEEIVFRLGGMTAVFYFTGSLPLALLLTSVAFGLEHIYQGPHGVLSATVNGVLLGLIFLSGGLVAAIAAHMTFNLISVLFRI